MKELYKLTKKSPHRVYCEFSDALKEELIERFGGITTSLMFDIPKNTIVDIYKNNYTDFDSRLGMYDDKEDTVYIKQNPFHKNYFTARVILMQPTGDANFDYYYQLFIRHHNSINIYIVINIDDFEAIKSVKDINFQEDNVETKTI